jgi:hypothetical protein
MGLAVDDAADEAARIRRWVKTAERPSNWKGRDTGNMMGAVDLDTRADLVTIRAWVEAVLAAVDSPVWAISQWATDAYWEQRRQIVLSQAQSRVGLSADQLPPELDADVRRALLGPDVTEVVLGYVERQGGFVPGLAGLTAPEREAMSYWLEPNEAGYIRKPEEIRDLMDRRRGRRGLPLAIKTVENNLSNARAKLRALATRMRDQSS